MAETPSRHELIQAAHDNWTVNRGFDDETLRDLGFDTIASLPETIERVRTMGDQPVAHTVSLGPVAVEPEKPTKPVKGKHRPGARAQARGETTSAEDGAWSNYA